MPRLTRVRWLVPVVLVLFGACADEPPTAPDRVMPEAADVVTLGAPDSIHSISAGGTHACGLDLSGAAYCWGANDQVQLGYSTTENCSAKACSTLPMPVGGGRHYTSVAAGGLHTCGVEAGTRYVWCWGDGSSGQLGDGTGQDNILPQRAVAPGVLFSSVSTGFSHTCALATTGRIWCWGYNGEGAVSGPDGSVLTPRRVAGPYNFAMVSAGGHHTCALGVNGVAYCWGANGEGQIGDPTETDTASTVRRVTGPGGYTWITTGGTTSCGVRGVNGRIYCWGANYFEALGRPGPGGPVPGQVSGGRTYDQVSLGGYHGCGRQTNGYVVCWGYGGIGQVGTGGNVTTNPPTRVPGPRTYGTLDVGEWFSCATDGLGSVFCWGDNTYGQIGRTLAETSTCGGIECAPSPRRVRGLVQFAS